MKIIQLMTTKVQTCIPQETLAAVAEKMWNWDVGCLPVIDTENHVVGMITDRDICMAAYTQGRVLSDILVTLAMSHDVISCSPNESIQAAEETMKSHQIRRLPVLDDNGKIAGIVTLNDIAREAEREVGRKGREITAQEITATLATINQPRQLEIQVEH